MSQTVLNPKGNKSKESEKSFFVVIDGSEDVLYLKCLDLSEAENEVKRFLKIDAIDDSVEIIY